MLDRIRPFALLLGRIGIGVIFLVHGWQKFTTMGISGTTAFFEQIGIPLPGLAAPAVAVLEVVGGIAFIVGAALPVFGVLLALDMVGAIVFVHGANGFAVDKGGYEFVLALAAAALAIGFSGGGALAADGLWRRGRRTEAVAV
ncbi:DoxX family protein [Streptosporangium sandarakinum]|uniref:Putative oxidoreductase n=1 Tax=Streptosporangium sandarakinum TaxID=1260955 RepID=A0A852V5F6_9ACTN|nr:DoxX family protein [Streptosporangium sandarakinum]NYF43709.1 putative oxidoreductase [Streptosporangium sandarakinum]